jgi:hypothetical protein
MHWVVLVLEKIGTRRITEVITTIAWFFGTLFLRRTYHWKADKYENEEEYELFFHPCMLAQGG